MVTVTPRHFQHARKSEKTVFSRLRSDHCLFTGVLKLQKTEKPLRRFRVHLSIRRIYLSLFYNPNGGFSEETTTYLCIDFDNIQGASRLNDDGPVLARRDVHPGGGRRRVLPGVVQGLADADADERQNDLQM